MLNFSNLTDDQLVDLVREACGEAVKRGMHVQGAVEAVMMGEAEKAKVAAEAATREAAKIRAEEEARIAKEAAERVRREAEKGKKDAEAATQRRKDARQAAVVDAVAALLERYEYKAGDDFSVTLWQNREKTEQRLYIDEGDGWVKRGWKVAVYVTGNREKRPGAVEGGIKNNLFDADVNAIGKVFAKWWSWNKGLKNTVWAGRADIQATQEYADALAALGQAMAEKEVAVGA